MNSFMVAILANAQAYPTSCGNEAEEKIKVLVLGTPLGFNT